MLEIVSLVTCGWLMMFHPTDNLKHPITEWEQWSASDSAVECENNIGYRWQYAQKQNREFKHDQWKCVPSDAVYPHTQPKK